MKCFITTASVLALGMALASTPVSAQVAAAAEEPGDIVVTALKREQSLQDAAATISVLTGEDLVRQGITQTQDLEAAIPGLQFGNSGIDGAKISLRGISSVRAFAGDDSAVAVHVNGVFLPFSGLALGGLFDIGRVEALKGPQGTLYGRNATAGAINIITARPTQELGGFAELTYGSFNTFRGNAALNLPVASGHAIRLAGTFANGDGYIRNTLDSRRFANEDRFGLRGSYAGDFGGVTADVVVEYIKDKGRNTFGGVVPVAAQPGAVGIAIKRDFFDTVVDATDVRENRRTFFASGTLNVPLSNDFTLRSITGYTDYDLDTAGDAQNLFNPAELGITATPSFGQAFASQKGYSVSQEVNLLGKIGDRIDLVVGAFYVKQAVTETRFGDNRGAPAAAPLGNLDDFFLRQTGEAYSVFADATVELVDNLRIFGGYRYNWEDKKQRQQQRSFFPGFGVPAPLSFAAELSTSYKDPSYRAGVEFDITQRNLLYASFGRGFRSGAIGGLVGVDNFFDVAFGGPGLLGLVRLEPEVADAIEVGSKNSFLDGRITINIAGFHTTYKDQLFFQFDPVTFQLVEGNIGRSRAYGVDLDIAARVTDSFSISVAAEYLNTKVTSVGSTATGGVAVGNRLPYAPELSFNLGADYRVPLGDMGELSANVDFSFKSEHFFNLAQAQGEDEIGLLSAGLRFESNSGFYVFATGRNLTNKKYFVGGGIDSRTPNQLATARPGTPRQLTVGAGFKF